MAKNKQPREPKAPKSDVIEVEGVVLEAMPNGVFRIQLDGLETEIMGTISGKMRMFRIRLLPGDRVKLELSPYDLTKGRITFRYKKGDKRPPVE